MTPSELVQAALAARAAAHAPYSDFAVGAALLDGAGAVHRGANVENASFGLTCCAERVALFRAVADGARAFTALAVVSATASAPCGACRQVLHEFAPRLVLHLADASGAFRTLTLDALLPEAFGPADLGAAASPPADTDPARRAP